MARGVKTHVLGCRRTEPDICLGGLRERKIQGGIFSTYRNTNGSTYTVGRETLQDSPGDI